MNDWSIGLSFPIFCNDYIDFDQFAYRGGHNSTMALIKCQHTWSKWLNGNADFVRIFSFDFSKAFDFVSHNILCSKLKQVKFSDDITVSLPIEANVSLDES